MASLGAGGGEGGKRVGKLRGGGVGWGVFVF